MNKVILSGGLTRDPELMTTQSGKSVVKFSLAVSDYKDSTLYFDCSCWDEKGERLAQYAKKGSQLMVEGRIKIDDFEKNGEKRRRYVIVVTDWEFIRGGRKQDDMAGEPATKVTNSEQNKSQSKPAPTYQKNEDEADAPVETNGETIDYDNLPF